MIILGIDPGTENTGYGIIQSDGTRHTQLDFGTIRLPARKPLALRLKELALRLREILARTAIDAMAVEDIFYAVNVKSALQLAHARGVILLCAAEAEIPTFEYAPLEIKKAVCGFGRAEKSQVQEMVRFLLHMKDLTIGNDASDALAVAICHAQVHHTLRAIENARRSSPRR